MDRQEPSSQSPRDPEPGSESPRDPEPGSDAAEPLRRLEQRLDQASEAAERLLAEAARAAAGGRREPSPRPGDSEEPARRARGNPRPRPPSGAGPGESTHANPGTPPAGWQIPEAEEPPERRRPDGDLLIQLVQSLRDLIPPELQRRLAEALREVLLAIRALIDWYLERLEQRRSQPAEVQDIPIL